MYKNKFTKVIQKNHRALPNKFDAIKPMFLAKIIFALKWFGRW